MKHKSKKQLSKMSLGELLAEAGKVVESQGKTSEEIDRINKQINKSLGLPEDYHQCKNQNSQTDQQ